METRRSSTASAPPLAGLGAAVLAACTTAADSGVAPDPFADAVVSFEPGEAAGFGQEGLPDIVLGPPLGGGDQGSLDVVSLGREGRIVLELHEPWLVDRDGVDLLVFENPFPGWIETGIVGVSLDGAEWHEWPCAWDDEAEGFLGCAGVQQVWANAEENGLDPTDPLVAGGDAFDLADLGMDEARFVSVRDSGANAYDGVAGGFDLDAIAVVRATDGS